MSKAKIPVLVTGLSGLVGSRFKALFSDKYSFENFDLAEGLDITQENQVDKAVQATEATTILHLAAFTNVSAAYEQNQNQTGLCYQINVTGTQNLVNAANKYSKYFIHISTDFVFDGAKQSLYEETDIPNPIEWYGETKYQAEKLVQESLKNYVIFRIAYPYQENPSRPDFLANLMEKLKTDTLPPAFTDHTITPTFVDDLAMVFDYSIEHQPTGLFHAVGSSQVTDFEMATKVKKQFGLAGTVKPGLLTDYLKTHPRPYQKTMRVSNQKIRREFGIRMKTFDEGLLTVWQQKKLG